MAPVFAAGGPPPGGLPVTIVAAASPVHSSGFAAAAARGYPVRMTGVPATLPDRGDRAAAERRAAGGAARAHLHACPAGRRAARWPPADLPAHDHRDQRAADRRGPRRDRAARSGYRRSASSSRPRGWPGAREPGDAVMRFATRHVHRRARRRPQPARRRRHGIGQGAGDQPAQPHPAADPLRAHRPLHPPPGRRRPVPARHRRRTRRRDIPLRYRHHRPARDTHSHGQDAGRNRVSGPPDRSRHRRRGRRRRRAGPCRRSRPRSSRACTPRACASRTCTCTRSPASPAIRRPARPAASSPGDSGRARQQGPGPSVLDRAVQRSRPPE